MSFRDAFGYWRHEVRRVDGGLRFYSGCKYCRVNRCCVDREDHLTKCPMRGLGR